MIQSVKKELAKRGEIYSFAELCELASKESIPSLVDCNDNCFLAPAESMINAVAEFCQRNNQPVPKSAGELLR